MDDGSALGGLQRVDAGREAPARPARPEPVRAADVSVLTELLTGRALPALAGSAEVARDLTGALREAAEAVVDLLGADGAAVALLDQDGAVRWTTATSQAAYLLVKVEGDFREGPGVDARAGGRPVATPDLRVGQRWLRLGPVAASHDLRAVLAVPVLARGRTVAVLTVVAASSRLWSEAEARAVGGYAAVLGRLFSTAADALEQRRLACQLQSALESRVVIEQAKGVLMERKKLPPAQAFQLLRRMARSSSRRVADVAAEMIADPRA
jgi:GAF domain-containing protein